MQSHFKDLLAHLRDGVAADGQAEGLRLDALKPSRASPHRSRRWALTHETGSEGPLQALKQAWGMPPSQRDLILGELHKGYQAYLSAALDHNASFDRIDLSDNRNLQTTILPYTPLQTNRDATPYTAVVEQYFTEVDRAGVLAEKTEVRSKTLLGCLAKSLVTSPCHSWINQTRVKSKTLF